MGLIYAEIKLTNGDDLALARRSVIGLDEVRSVRINMLVDTGAYMMTINDVIQEYLQLPVAYRKKARTANGLIGEYDVVGPIQVKFKNRDAICHAMVLPGDEEPLLGAIPMEELDVVINPLRQELDVNPKHPDAAQYRL